MKPFFKRIILILVLVLLLLIIAIAYVRTFIEHNTPHQSAPSETQFITLENGDEIAYQEIDHNASTTVLFVGGLSGWAGTWKRTVSELDKNLQNQKYNFIMIDLPPFGFSTAKGSFMRDAQAERINMFRDAKGLDHTIFVGHSYGAGIVTEAVMENPAGVEKLIVIDGVLNIGEKKMVKETIVTKNVKLLGFGLSLAVHIPPLVENRLKGFVFNTEHIDNELAKLYMRSFDVRGTSEKFARWIRDYMLDPLVYKSTEIEEYAKLSMPVRLIWGVEDTLTPLALGKELLGLLPDGKLYELQAVGHIPMIEDYAQLDGTLLKALEQ